ncbi:FAD-binding oxidoreductase [Patescibacteria group bacterium]|nr:FAD-binding oxidoreductase [Patescibacteria group bacterium]
MQWVGFEATHYATLNSAALCHAVLAFLLAKYPDRFEVYEHARIDAITMEPHGASLQCGTHTVQCKEVVLATNAFKHHTINAKKDSVHVDPIRGYMAGYVTQNIPAPKTICYQPPGKNYSDAYFYQTTRHYLDQDFTDSVLLTLG